MTASRFSDGNPCLCAVTVQVFIVLVTAAVPIIQTHGTSQIPAPTYMVHIVQHSTKGTKNTDRQPKRRPYDYHVQVTDGRHPAWMDVIIVTFGIRPDYSILINNSYYGGPE